MCAVQINTHDNYVLLWDLGLQIDAIYPAELFYWCKPQDSTHLL